MARRGLTLPPKPANEGYGGASPVAFVRGVLGGDPWERQEEILAALGAKSRVAVRSCHHSGKTWNAAAAVHWFVRAFDPSLVLTTAPTDRQVRELLWYEIANQQRQAGLDGRMTETSLEVSPTQRAFGFSTNTPERFQGWHCESILVVVDEASGVPETIYEAIEGCLTGPNARLLLIGNPNNPSGTFFEAFRSALYAKFHISAYDVPERLLPRAWAQERRQEWGEESPAYQVRVLGNFPEQGDNALISLRWVEAAQERKLEPATWPVEIGVDVSEYGSDESVAYVRAGSVVVDQDYWRGHDPMQSAARVASLANKWDPVLIKVDDIGIGAGVRARLLEEKYPVVGVNVGEAARDSEHYANKRSEVFFGLRERFREGDIAVPKEDNVLLDQLVALTFSYTPRGQWKLEPKEEMRKNRPRNARWQSPDRADALALCFSQAYGSYQPAHALGEERSLW